MSLTRKANGRALSKRFVKQAKHHFASAASEEATKAWAVFFCFGCTRQRPLDDKHKRGKRALCSDCMTAARSAREGFLRRETVEDEEPEPIPQSILDAYAESQSTD